MRRAAILVLAAGALWAGGCTSPQRVTVGREPPPPADAVDWVMVRLSPPTPVNWDDAPGPDGLEVHMNFFCIEEPLSVAVNGSLEFLLYEGKVSPEQLEVLRPARTWAFDNRLLRDHRERTILGWGYAIRLAWGNRPPQSRYITLMARYSPSQGSPRLSEPRYIPMRAS